MPYNCPMARRRFQLSEEQIKGLTMAYATCKDGPTRTRFQAVRLYGIGYPVVQIMDITGCSRTSLMDWNRFCRPSLTCPFRSCGIVVPDILVRPSEKCWRLTRDWS